MNESRARYGWESDFPRFSSSEARIIRESLASFVRDAVARYLAVRRFRALRAGVLPFAEAQGILTDEDVFKALS